MVSRRPFIILDRDGTVIQERHYLADPAGVELIPGAALALAGLRALGYGLVVATNQAGVSAATLIGPRWNASTSG